MSGENFPEQFCSDVEHKATVATEEGLNFAYVTVSAFSMSSEIFIEEGELMMA